MRGIYAVWGGPATWEELGRGHDARPLYVGKSKLLGYRLPCVHFCDIDAVEGTSERSPTGQSTLRRTLAAFLWKPLALCTVPRKLQAAGRPKRGIAVHRNGGPAHAVHMGIWSRGDDLLLTPRTESSSRALRWVVRAMGVWP